LLLHRRTGRPEAGWLRLRRLRLLVRHPDLSMKRPPEWAAFFVPGIQV